MPISKNQDQSKEMKRSKYQNLEIKTNPKKSRDQRPSSKTQDQSEEIKRLIRRNAKQIHKNHNQCLEIQKNLQKNKRST